jgi:hypothetical protein
MIDNAVAIYCFIDDYLKAVKHKEDVQCKMCDAEVILVGMLSCFYFRGHYAHTCNMLVNKSCLAIP